MADAAAIAFGAKNGLPLKPNEQNLGHFRRFKQDISKSIPDVHSMFVRFNMLDELKGIRKAKTWKGAHKNFDPLAETKRVEKECRERRELEKINRPRCYKPPTEKKEDPRDFIVPDFKSDNSHLNHGINILTSKIALAEKALNESKKRCKVNKKLQESGVDPRPPAQNEWDAPPRNATMVTEYSAKLYGRSIEMTDRLGLRPVGHTREMQDDFEHREMMIKQAELIRVDKFHKVKK